MKIAIHQPNYIPWLGYFDKLKKSDLFVLLDDVQYSGDKISSRNLIRTSNGIQYLSIPIRKRRELLCNIEIDNSKNWRHDHWKSIKNNYGKSKGWIEFSKEIEKVYSCEWYKLVDINIEFIKLICNKLEINTEIVRSSTLNKNFGVKSERILNICKYFDAEIFLSGNGAKEYLDVKAFNENGIEIEFQKFTHPIYKQINEPFITNLSAIDFLLQCGKEAKI